MAFRIMFVVLALAVAWTNGALYPGLVGLNENEDLVLNSGEQGAVLANGVDIVARFNTLDKNVTDQEIAINTAATIFDTLSLQVSKLAEDMYVMFSSVIACRVDSYVS